MADILQTMISKELSSMKIVVSIYILMNFVPGVPFDNGIEQAITYTNIDEIFNTICITVSSKASQILDNSIVWSTACSS